MLMPMQSGSEVLAYCGSCKMDLTAVIVAKVGGKIAKVMCKTCKKERAYRAPKGVSDPAMAAEAVSRKSRATSGNGATAKSVPIEQEWRRLMADADKTNRVKYSVKVKLNQGDVVQHPTFGDGIVMRIAHPDKAEVLFQNDTKLLIHSR